MSQHRRILWIEDDPRIGELVRDQLTDSGHSVSWATDGDVGFEWSVNETFDLVILDLMLPSMDGLDICRCIRRDDPRTPILILSAKAELHDVVLGLEIGADDYVTKPFRMAELMARVATLFRRTEAAAGPDDEEASNQPLHRGALTIDPVRRLVTVHGRSVALTAKEFALLLTFARHPGRGFSRSELLDRVWGADFDGFDHTVNTHINRLRTKVEEDPARPRYIQTVWGVGYRFVALDEMEP